MFKTLKKSFTLIELLVVITIIAILAGLVLPQLGKARDAANRTTANNAVKGLCSAVIAETGMSKGSYYKGLFDDRIWTITEDTWNLIVEPSGYTGQTLKNTTFKALWENAAVDPANPTYANIPLLLSTDLDTATLETMVLGTYAGFGTVLTETASAVPNNNESSSLDVFSTFNAEHPFLGFFVFDGRDYNNTTTTFLTRGKKKLGTDIRIIGEAYQPGEGDGFGAIGFGDGHVSIMKLGVYDSNSTPEIHYGTITGNVMNARGEVDDINLQP